MQKTNCKMAFAIAKNADLMYNIINILTGGKK
jgi:hypothetical protein